MHYIGTKEEVVDPNASMPLGTVWHLSRVTGDWRLSQQTIGNAMFLFFFTRLFLLYVGRDSSVGIATHYGLDGPGIEFRWGRDFPHSSRPALGPTQPPVHCVPGLSWVVQLPGRGADHPPI